MANLAIARERHIGQVQRAVGEQLPGCKTAVCVVVGTFATLQNRVQVALRAQNLLGPERAVLVSAAGARKRARVNQHHLAVRRMQRTGSPEPAAVSRSAPASPEREEEKGEGGPAVITGEDEERLMEALKDALLRLDVLHGDNPDYFLMPWRRFFARARLRRSEYAAFMGLCRQIRWKVQK